MILPEVANKTIIKFDCALKGRQVGPFDLTQDRQKSDFFQKK